MYFWIQNPLTFLLIIHAFPKMMESCQSTNLIRLTIQKRYNEGLGDQQVGTEERVLFPGLGS